jgi:hypothetical protein
MASTAPSFINLRSTGNSGYLTHYDDGRFLSVWTDFDRSGGAYVYGKVFNADGTAAGSHFLIDYSAKASYREITAETLTDGRTVVAWVKSDGSGALVVGKVLSTSFVPPNELLTFSPGAQAEEAPQIHAMADGEFAVLYRGSGTFDGEAFTGVIANSFSPQGAGWQSDYHGGLNDLPNDGSNSTTVLKDGTCVVAFSVAAQGGTNVGVAILGPNGTWITVFTDGVPGVSSGIKPAISALANGGFVVAWEDVAENDVHVIRAQTFDSSGEPTTTTPITFTKANGSIVGNPVIEQLDSGGLAIAYVVDAGGDYNLYTEAVTSTGQPLVSRTLVGISSSGDQWDPSISNLSGTDYAVSWQSSGEAGGPQYIVEVIGREGTDVTTPITPAGGGPTGPGDPGRPGEPHRPPATTWTGTEGNDVHTGSAASEAFNGLGGRDSIRGLGGNDTIDGGSGNDKIWGGTGNDVLRHQAEQEHEQGHHCRFQQSVRQHLARQQGVHQARQEGLREKARDDQEVLLRLREGQGQGRLHHLQQEEGHDLLRCRRLRIEEGRGDRHGEKRQHARPLGFLRHLKGGACLTAAPRKTPAAMRPPRFP